MSSKLRDDKIGALSQNAGTITLGTSVLTIGGRQYSTSSLQVAVGSHGLVALRYIYAIVSGGVPALTISSSPNSVGPGTSSWKLVGAFYTNGVDGSFGSFVNISGAPQTNKMDYSQVQDNFGASVTNYAEWTRMGDHLLLSFGFTTGTSVAALAAISLPTNLSLNHSSGLIEIVGKAGVTESTVDLNLLADPSTSVAKLYFGLANSGATPFGASNATGITGAPGDAIRGFARINIQGWDITPLEDL